MLVQQVIKRKTLTASHELTVHVQNIKEYGHTSFTVHLDFLEMHDDKSIIIVNREEVTTTSDSKNEYVSIWQQFEQATYPLTVETNGYGDFINIIDFEVWLTAWQKKADDIVTASGNSAMAKDARGRFLSRISNPKLFVSNSLKDAFWNVMFSNFDEVNPSFQWYIKSIGALTCNGTLQEVETGEKTSAVHFFAETLLPEDMIDILKDSASLEHVHWIKRAATLELDLVYEQNKLIGKEASFTLVIDEDFSYIEKVSIEFKPEILPLPDIENKEVDTLPPPAETTAIS
jgi:hypothetical protein